MTATVDLVKKVRSGVIHIEYSSHGERIGSRTSFMCRGRLVTNNHVYHTNRNPIVTLAWQPDADVASREEIKMGTRSSNGRS